MENKRFNQNSYLIRRKVFKFVGAAFHIYNGQGEVEFYVKQKGFKLKEDIRVFTGEDMKEEVLLIQARNVIDFSAVYDVYDSNTNEKVGSLQRKGLKSMIKDEWIILDINGIEVGSIKEDSTGLALVRRFLVNIIPQSFVGTIGNEQVFIFKQRFNPFIQKIGLDFTDSNNVLDKRLGIAAGVLLCAIEGRQN
jgi:uncharacterized protein YxjI